MLKKKIDFSKVKNKVNRNNLPLIGNRIKSQIINRTQKGLDYNNRVFKGYEEEYRRRKRELFGSSKPNLTQTQKMLNAIRWRETKRGIKFYFGSNIESKKAYSNQVKNGRKFFGIDPKQREWIKKELKNFIFS